MTHTTPSKVAGIVCSMLALFALSTAGVASVSAQSAEEMTTLHSGAPLQDAKGTDKGKPPSVPSTGPGTAAIFAVAVGAGYLTMRRLRA